MMSDWLSPNPPHIADTLSVTKQMKIEIDIENFVRTNTLELNTDVECVFKIDASFGLKGQLFKLSKSNNLDLTQRVSVLIGRSASIGEEWDYANFTNIEWQNIFNPKSKLSEHVIKEYEKTIALKFDLRFKEFKSYFIEKAEIQNEETRKLNLTYTGKYIFNGLNSRKFYSIENLSKKVESIKFDEIENQNIIEIYANLEKWYWQIWIIDTEENSYMFEEIIIS